MKQFEVIPQKHIEAYVTYCQASGRLCDHDLIYLSVFDNYCHNNWPGSNNITQEMVDQWSAQRQTEKNNSIRSRIYPLIGFLSYLKQRKLTDITLPKIPKYERSTYIPHSFSNNELTRFFGACDSFKIHQHSFRSMNLKATIPVFFRLLYSSGIRTTEARLLKTEDVDLKNGILNIRQSKGYDQHHVVLHETMAIVLRQYDDYIKKLYPERTYFFPKNKEEGRTRYWVWSTFRKIWDSVNDSYATPYELRHHYAIVNINKWVSSGFNFYDKLVYLSKSMGHSSLESTKYYYSLVPALSDIMKDLSESDFNDIIPEVYDEENK